MAGALILTYHAVETGPAPLCTDPSLFREQMDMIAESGVRSLTVRDLVAELAAGGPHGTIVAITFDDGFASVADTAAPLLRERGLAATLFCVSGHLGGANDWPSARNGAYHSRLASESALADLGGAGFEIGSHGVDHAPLTGASDVQLRREVRASRRALEEAVGVTVTSYAYPYGALPGARGRALVSETYDAACTTHMQRVSSGADVHALPRIDAYYLRRPELLERALQGRLGAYFRTRGIVARARRIVQKDYARSAATPGA